MVGVEIDMVVTDSLGALAQYEAIFEVERMEVTALERGQNEAVFTLYGSRFHLLDANSDFQMLAPRQEDARPVWFNVTVSDIRAVYDKAMAAGCTEVQPVTELPEMGVSSGLFMDSFGYMWMLHQIHQEVSFEERSRVMEQQMNDR